MKTKLLTGIMAILVLSGCERSLTEYNNSDESTTATKAGYRAYGYTGEYLGYFTDIIAYTRMFREYIRQNTLEGRDSVNALYFKNINIVKHKDPRNLEDIYMLKAWNMPGRNNYTISYTRPDRDTWKIQAVVEHLDVELIFFLTIDNIYSQQWTVSESSCIPKALLYMKDNKKTKTRGYDAEFVDYEPYDKTFQVTNKPLTVEWWKTKVDLFAFELSGSGMLESYAKPKLRITYRFTSPITVFTHGAFLEDAKNIKWENRCNQLTTLQTGQLELNVADSISNTTDKYVVRLNDDRLQIVTPKANDEWMRN